MTGRKVFSSIKSLPRAALLLGWLAVQLALPACDSGSQVQTAFLGGIALSLSNSVLQVSSPTVSLGLPDTVTLTTEDQKGNVFISPNPLSVSFSLTGGTSAGSFSQVIDHGNGTYTATFTGSSAGTVSTLQAFVGGSLIQSPLPTILVTGGSLISLPGSPFNYTTGASVSITPTIGASVTSVSINPALGNSLSFNTTTGVISGTASGTLSATNYTLTATNSIGQTASVTISLGIYAAPTISVAGSPFTYATGSAISNVTPTLGSSVTSVSISPDITATGLSFNTTTGVISGTPTSTIGATNYILTASNAAGSTATATISVTVNAPNPTISFSGSPYAYTTGASVSITPTLTNTSTVSISSALGNGLGLNTSTGVISGTASGTLAATAYTLTATNSTGQTASTTISLGIYAAPTISIAGSPFTYITGSAIAAVTPTLGPSVTSVSISPNITTTGLAFNTTTGVISGTPTSTEGATTYTLTATNLAGSTATVTISVTINSPAPTISILGSPFSYTTGAAVSITPSLGASVTSVSISPALGNSLNLNTTTGVISGTSSGTLAPTNYTLTASNSTGQTASTTISIGIYAAPTISVSGSPFTFVTGSAITAVTPTLGSSVTGVSISPNITTTGLAFNATTGVISGTPTSTEGATNYILTASNFAGATTTATISVTINSPAPTISILGSPFAYTTGDVVSITPTLSASVTSVAISSALGNSLSFNTTTGVISGTSSGTLVATSYTLTAHNSTGQTASTTISIGIYAAPTISVAGSPFTFTNGVAISSITPTIGGSVTGVSVSPLIPFTATGLTFNSTTGVISGTPSATSSATTYTLTASNAAGATATATLSITINAPNPTISFSGSPYAYTTGAAVSLTPSLTNTSSVSISSALGNSLSLNTSTGVISGTASGTLSTTTYTLTATNSTGQTASTTISLTIYAAPTISVAGSPFTFEVGTAISSVVPTLGSAVSSVAISPNITSTGLSFNTTTGTISGTATSTEGATTYTLTASNLAGATATATISVTVNAALSVSPTAITLAVNDTTTFTASNGVSSYTYSVNGGGAGGTINSSTGVYTAPSAVGSGSDTVKVTDSAGNSVTAVVTLHPALSISPTSTTVTVGGTHTFTASNGVSGYTFSVNGGGAGGTINSSTGVYTAPTLVGSGSDTVKVTDSVGNTATATVTINPGAVSQLVMTTQPASNANETAATNFSVVVIEEDTYGNTVTSATDSIGVSISNDASGLGATLTGGTAISASSGVASFTLAINYAGTGYALQAGTFVGSTPYTVTSNSFNIVAGSGSQLAFIINPSGTTPNTSISPAMTVQIEDAGGNAISTSGVTVTLAIASGAGTLSGPLTASSNASGLATFSGISLDNAGSYTLSASAINYTGATSQPFYISNNTLNLEVPIEMIDNGEPSITGNTTSFGASRTYLNPSNYTGSAVTYNFEIVATNANTSHNYNVLLKDLSGTTFATIPVPSSLPTPTRVRASFTPSTTVQNESYKVVLPKTQNANDVVVSEARILVSQTNADTTQIYVPLLNAPALQNLSGDSTSSTTGGTSLNQQTPLYYTYWTYNAGAYQTLAAGTPFTFTVDLYSGTSGSTVYAALWDVTAGAIVAGSTISTSQFTGSASVFQTSLPASAFTDGHIYTTTLWSYSSSNTAFLKKAGLSILLQNLTAAQVYYRVARGGTYSAPTIVNYQQALLDLSLFTSPTLAFQCMGYLSAANVTNTLKLYDVTASSANAASVSYSSTSLASQSSSPSITNGDSFSIDFTQAAPTIDNGNCMAIVTVN